MQSQLRQIATNLGVDLDRSRDARLKLEVYRCTVQAIYMLFFEVHMTDLTVNALLVLATDLGQILTDLSRMRFENPQALEQLQGTDAVVELLTDARLRLYEAVKLIEGEDANTSRRQTVLSTNKRQTIFNNKIKDCQNGLLQAYNRF